MATAGKHLEASLANPLDKETKGRIGHAFFGNTFEQKGGIDAFEAYFHYYEDQIDWLLGGLPQDTGRVPGLIARTHDDLITIATVLRENANCDKSEIREKLRQHERFDDAESWVIDRSVDLTLRLWLQINIRDDESGTGVPEARWNEHLTLTKFLSDLFPIEVWDLGAKERRLDPYFTGANMVQICRLNIGWTDSLEDHLRLERCEEKDKVLRIFPHKRTLQALLAEADRGSSHRSPLPTTVLKETIRTLDLLFPFWDERTKDFLKREGQTFHDIMGPIEYGRRLHLLDFPHWKVRLLEVYEEVFQSPPVSWAQLWRDQRNPQQFWTFWIALVILALTLVSTIASVVSMYTGIIQKNLAEEGLRLAFAATDKCQFEVNSQLCQPA